MKAALSATEWMGIISMKNNNFGYLLGEGVRSIFQHGFMSFAAVCVTVACLLIIGSFSLILYNVNIMVVDMEKENEVMVYIDESYDEAEAKSVGSRINMIENVEKATFITKESALQNFIANQGEGSAFEGLSASTFRHRFVVTLQDNSMMHDTVERIRQITGVVNISANDEMAEGFTTIQNVLRIATIAIIALLLVVSLLIISNTVKLAMYDRRDEIAIMKMVGATNGFIRLPFIVQGFLLGITGAAAAFFIEWGLYDALTRKIASMDSMQLFSFVPFMNVLWPMVAVFAAAGLFVGVFGSLSSIRKFLEV